MQPEPAFSDPMLPRPFRVVTRRRDLPDTFTFELTPPPGAAPLTFAPGQFNMLYLFGLGEVPISVSGNADAPERLVHTVRVVGSVTRGFASLDVGDTVGVRGPFGTAWPVEAAEGGDVVIAAGGLGLAPLRPAILRLLMRRERYRRVSILYGARNPDSLLYADELRTWRSQFDIDCIVTVDAAGTDWHGRVGAITKLINLADVDPAHCTALVCGPEIMMRVVADALGRRGFTDAQIHVSLERNMKCAIGHCGHCQFGPLFVCRDGPVFSYDRVRAGLAVAGL
jgi:NAD(P)H-flavin reductase